MFEPTSRYYNIENAKLKREDGTFIVCKKRRFLPLQGKTTTSSLAEIVVTTGDRLDLIAARTLGDPEQYWRISDVNDKMHPLDLTSEPRMVLNVPLPGI